MEFSVIGVFCYNGGTLSFRFGLDSSIDVVTRKVCDKWPDLGLRSFSMCFSCDAKENLIETDGDLRSLACYCYGMKIATVEIKVNVCMSSMSSYSGQVHQRNFDGGVGQIFALGAPEFRDKLIEYSIVSGYKYELIKNDDFRVTAVCQKKNELNCQWCFHSLESYGLFPLAVGVVDIENDSNWYWFLDMFKKAFGYERSHVRWNSDEDDEDGVCPEDGMQELEKFSLS
ncbi:hypothetical protein IFM89_024828 [Coptis chinensis]|uniref:Transposase MuDR plant domain-containing protein n=1 Tax=Coptis chinensis TaxID=261450 RepID=A0A835HNF9_9MAGN|nr:hypothetical protein IFM89_024828 [Coptis chinensis]